MSFYKSTLNLIISNDLDSECEKLANEPYKLK